MQIILSFRFDRPVASWASGLRVDQYYFSDGIRQGRQAVDICGATGRFFFRTGGCGMLVPSPADGAATGEPEPSYLPLHIEREILRNSIETRQMPVLEDPFCSYFKQKQLGNSNPMKPT